MLHENVRACFVARKDGYLDQSDFFSFTYERNNGARKQWYIAVHSSGTYGSTLSARSFDLR